MKFAEINVMFTEEIAKYLNNGYVIHPYTMAGHQGEIAKVDLSNGHEVIRIWLDKCNSHDLYFRYGVVLTVGRCTDERLINDRGYLWNDVMWCDKLEVIEKRTFWQMLRNYRETDWYIEGEDGVKAMAKSHERSERRYSGNGIKEVHFDKSMYRTALKMVRKTPYNKTKRLTDIEDFWKVSYRGEKPVYYVKVKGTKVKVA